MNAPAISSLSTVLLCALLAACHPAEKPLPPDVLAAVSLHYNQNDPAGAADLFTDNGVIMSEFGDNVQGKEGLVAFFKSELNKNLQYWPTSEHSGAVGDLGYDYGTLRVHDTVSRTDKQTLKYMSLYRKVGGSWKIERTIFNTDSPLACSSVQVEPEGAPQTAR